MIAVALSGFSTGCVIPPPTQEQLANASHGEAPTECEKKIREAFASMLVDPESANYEIGSPEKGWGSSGLSNVFGWVVRTKVNSKNRFGAYAGWKEYKVLFVDDKIKGVYEAKGKDNAGDPIFARVR